VTRVIISTLYLIGELLGAGGPIRDRIRWQGPQVHDAAPESEPGLLGALLDGLVGVVSEPVRGADEGGLLGLLRGLVRGATGVLVGPAASMLETSARMADSIRRSEATDTLVRCTRLSVASFIDVLGSVWLCLWEQLGLFAEGQKWIMCA
jgi:hypothetical protein